MKSAKTLSRALEADCKNGIAKMLALLRIGVTNFKNEVTKTRQKGYKTGDRGYKNQQCMIIVMKLPGGAVKIMSSPSMPTISGA